MPDLKVNSLVLYKKRPALIKEIGAKKISLTTEDGKASVRPKDVQLLHLGPLNALSQLTSPTGDIETARELLVGETTTLEEFSELAFEAFTPQTAWAIWQLVADGLYLHGTPDELYIRSEDEIEALQKARDAKAAEAAAWDGFVARVQNRVVVEEDGRFLQDLILFANGQQKQSKLLKALKQSEFIENGHRLLLNLGLWDEMVNPYPIRAGVAVNSAKVSIPELPDEERRDLTHLVSLAIDDEGSKDPDDAISWDNGRIWIHIADVAAVVPPDSPADLEARDRGANLYLPEGTITMLPEAATAVLGLGLQETSPALSFGLVLNNEGEIEELEIAPSWVKVTRTTYAEAETRLDQSPYKEIKAVTDRYAERRKAFGAIEIDLPEVRIRVKDEKVGIRPLPNLGSRDLVRDAMLMTGEAAARFAFEHQIPIPYTTQAAPVDELPEPTSPTNMFARRKMMSPSQPGSVPGAHHGLGMGLYAQATSPLRRYLDLVVHQQLRAYLRNEPLMDETAVMRRVGAADLISREVRYAERQSNKHWTLVYLMQNPEWQGEAIVVEKRGKRDTVLIPNLGFDVQIHGGGQRPLNSTVSLQVRSVNLPQLEAHFQPVTQSAA
ncbi:MAG: RNB domain-containing ribonuclease [Chloroflexota bacterium]